MLMQLFLYKTIQTFHHDITMHSLPFLIVFTKEIQIKLIKKYPTSSAVCSRNVESMRKS